MGIFIYFLIQDRSNAGPWRWADKTRSSEKVQKPYIIRVSSTKGGVGKSAIAVNLAVSIEMYGYRTLIVDLDTINPSVGLYLGLANVSIGAEEAMNN